MDSKVKQAIESGAKTYAALENIETGAFISAIETVFDTEAPYMDKVQLMDDVFDNTPAFEELREVFFDLLMINFSEIR